MSENLIFYYTGLTFWVIFGIAFFAALVGSAIFLYFFSYNRMKMWKSWKMIEELGVDEAWFRKRGNFLYGYNKKQTLLISAFLRRVNEELVKNDKT